MQFISFPAENVLVFCGLIPSVEFLFFSKINYTLQFNSLEELGLINYEMKPVATDLMFNTIPGRMNRIHMY